MSVPKCVSSIKWLQTEYVAFIFPFEVKPEKLESGYSKNLYLSTTQNLFNLINLAFNIKIKSLHLNINGKGAIHIAEFIKLSCSKC